MKTIILILIIMVSFQKAEASVSADCDIHISGTEPLQTGEYQFDIVFKNLSPERLYYAVCQFIIEFQPEAVSVGKPELLLVPGSSGLTPAQVPAADKLTITENEIRIFGEPPPGINKCTVIEPGGSLTVGRFKLKNPPGFSGEKFNLRLKLEGKFVTKAYSYKGSSLKRLEIKSGSIPFITEGKSESKSSPSLFTLFRNYPNPFNPETVISFDIHEKARVSVEIYNTAGELASTLIHNREMEANSYTFTFNAEGLPGGAYFCVLTAGDYRLSRKIILLK